MYICKFCQKECKNHNSFRNHERMCKHNPSKFPSPFSDPEIRSKFMINYKNGATKAKELGLEYVVTETTRKKLSEAMKNRTDEENKENGKRISAAICKKVQEGTWHTSIAKRMHYDYNGIDLHGKWELRYAEYLDKNSINWRRPKERFPYTLDGKTRYYTPDFFLIDENVYVEIKGFQTPKDTAKWNQFPSDKKLLVLKKLELKELGII